MTEQPQDRTYPTPPVSALKATFFLAFLFCIFSVLLEFGAHAYLKATSGYDGQHLLQYAFDPYKNILPTPNFVDTRGIRHNSVGFRRSSEVPVQKPAGTYRVFLMGASTAYGLGGLWPHIQNDFPVIPNDRTIDAYLERSLAARLPGLKIEVINAAITSTWTHHNLIYLNQTVLRYDPDMVLFLDGFNDFYAAENGYDQFASYAYGEQSSRILGEPTIGSLVFQNFWWLYRKSAFVHLVTREGRKLAGLRGPGVRTPIDVDQRMSRLQEVFRRNALQMVQRYVRITRDAGAIPVEIHQPMLILERDRAGLSGVERKLFDYNVSSYLPNYEPFMHRATPWVVDTLAQAVARAGGHFVDATRIFGQSNGQMFTDYCHLTPKGNELLAAYIERSIVPLIEADLTARAGR